MLDYHHMVHNMKAEMAFKRDEMDVLLEVVQASTLNHTENVLAFERVEY